MKFLVKGRTHTWYYWSFLDEEDSTGWLFSVDSFNVLHIEQSTKAWRTQLDVDRYIWDFPKGKDRQTLARMVLPHLNRRYGIPQGIDRAIMRCPEALITEALLR